jgi:hypothetical protein
VAHQQHWYSIWYCTAHRVHVNPMPVIGFDLTTNSHRLLFQVLTELAI